MNRTSRRRLGLLVALIVLWGSVLSNQSPASAAATQIDWKRVQLRSSDFQDIVRSGKGNLVAVGDDSTIAYSDNGENWNYTASPVIANLRAIAANRKRYVAVGDRGAVITSTNGKQWTAGKIKLDYTVGDFRGQNSRSSKDRAAMKVKYTQKDVALTSVVWDGSKFLAYGIMSVKVEGMSYPVPVLIVSQDGASWSMYPVWKSELIGGLESGKLFVHKGNAFILQDQYVVYSSDYKKWIVQKSGIGVTVHKIATNGTRLVAVGWDGRLQGSDVKQPRMTGIIYTSTDGLHWQELNRDPNAKGNSAAGKLDLSRLSVGAVSWDGSRFIAGIEKGGFAQSTDGLGWTFMDTNQQAESDASASPFFKQKYGGMLANSNGLYADQERVVTVGSMGTIRTSLPEMREWKVVAEGKVRNLSSVKASGSRIVAFGEGVIVESRDGGVNWDVHNPKEIERAYFYSTAAVQNVFAVRGIDNVDGKLESFIYSSNQHGVWTMHPGGEFTSKPRAVYAWDQQLVVKLLEGTAASTDGSTWSTKSVSTPYVEQLASNGRIAIGRQVDAESFSNVLMLYNGTKWTASKHTANVVRGAVWDGRQFIAIADNQIITSKNGADWKSTSNSYGMNAIAYGGGKILIACDKGTLLESADGVRWEGKSVSTAMDLTDIVWDSNGKKFIVSGKGGTILVGTLK